MKLALSRKERQSSSAIVLLAEEHTHSVFGEGELRIETMRLFKIAERGVHLRHLLLEHTASQIETRLGWQLLNAKGEEVRTNFEGAMVEGHLREREICRRVPGIDLDRFAEP